jgi:RNA polymerase sigma factor (sigma-70 family)
MQQDFLNIVNDNKGLIYKVCNLYCPDVEDRKDLFQEILLQLWKSHQNFKGASAIGTWIYRVALNTAITHFKQKNKGKPQRNVVLADLEIPDLLNPEEQEEQFTLMYRAIGLLDKIEKSIVFLYLEDKSYDEMAEITGLSKTHIGVKLNRIKSKLAQILNQ